MSEQAPILLMQCNALWGSPKALLHSPHSLLDEESVCCSVAMMASVSRASNLPTETRISELDVIHPDP